MSYLQLPRITFAGRYLSDVPTMNNDPGSFGGDVPPEPGWNPYGSGAFDLLGCLVTGGEGRRGAACSLAGLAVLTAPDRAGAKLADLDPDWQFSPQIWGLTIRIAGPGGETLLSGRYRPAACRDLWARAGAEGDASSQGASFTSVLEDVRYGSAAVPLLAELREVSPERLSIGLNLYGFSARRGTAAFATGRLTGCIGPWRAGEPLSFVAGRRLDGGTLPLPPGAPTAQPVATTSHLAGDAPSGLTGERPSGLAGEAPSRPADDVLTGRTREMPSGLAGDAFSGLEGSLASGQGDEVPFDPGGAPSRPAGEVPFGAAGEIRFGRAVAVVDGGRLVVDLGNAYPFAAPPAQPGAVHAGAGRIDVAVLPGEHVQAGDVLAPGDGLLCVGTAELLPSLPPAGIVSFPLTPDAADALERRPLALVSPLPGGGARVVSRETRDGLYVRADDFVHRVEAGAAAVLTLYARRYGRPAGGLTIHLERAGDGRPALGVPARVRTGGDGTATVRLTAGDPGNPRRGLDGVVERVAYSLRTAPGGGLDLAGSGLDPFVDVVAAHVRAAYPPPPDDDLERAVQEILAPYARHYPIMGEHLVDLGDLDAVRPWRAAMLLALSRDITDPNHMPVSRDLSAPRRAAVLRWLHGLRTGPGGVTGHPDEPDPTGEAGESC